MENHMFTADGTSKFEGWSSSKEGSWNGWAKPVFDYDTACAVLDEYVEKEYNDGHDWRYNEDDDTFYLADVTCSRPLEYKGIECVINGEKKIMYPIGSGEWCWYACD